MGRNWAITIGINNYDNLQSLSYAKRDAEAVRDFCLQDVGFEKVYYLSDDSPQIETDSGPPLRSQPTFGTLSRFLRVRFEQAFLHPGDNFWFFFAGHGKRYRDRDYLMPIDADPGNVEGTAISINYVAERLRRCGADNVILLLDACRNDGDRDGEGIGIETQQGVVTLFACSPSERSYEIEELQQGAFTYALLQGLRIQGEGNCATVERLYQHLRYQVLELNRHYQKPKQTPYVIAEPATKLHLILLPKQATLADVTILKNDALEAEAEGDLELAEQLWIRILIVFPTDRQAVKAIKRLAVQIAGNTQSITTQHAPLASKADDAEVNNVESRLIQQQHERDVLQYQLDLKSIEADSFKARQEFEFKSRLIDARLQGHIDAMQGRQSPRKRPKKLPSLPSTVSTFDFDIVTVDVHGRETRRKRRHAQYFSEDLGNGVVLELVSIPGGSFQMGSPDGEGDNEERPQHSVIVKPFSMGKYPVTQAQWRVIAASPKISRDLDPDPSQFKGGDRPIEQVSWYDAVEFCARLSRKTGHEYRLPSEAEWEYACRAGTTTPFHFGETITADLANYDGNRTYAFGPKGSCRGQTIDVGSFSPNASGLYGMHGNVWEWCLDHWHENYQGAPSEGSAWEGSGNSNRRLLRGGSWHDIPRNCRSANRFRGGPDIGYDYIGFRVVCASAWTLLV